MTKRSIAPSSATGVRLLLGVTLGLGAFVAFPARAHATEAEAVSLEEDNSQPAEKKEKEDDQPKRKKKIFAPYSLPWMLRPAAPTSMARADTVAAFYGVDGGTIVSQLSFSYKLMPRLALLAKLGVAEDSPPTGAGGFGLFNPLIGGHVGFWPAKSLRFGGFLGLTIPMGMGGGANPDKGSVEVNHGAMLARGGMDDALFMPDYITALPGLDLAYVTKGFTVQGEITLGILTKVRGPETEKSTNSDLSMGLHLGYFLFPFVSVGAELRHQRWLSTPRFVGADLSRELRDVTSLSLGPRAHIELEEDFKFRPGFSMTFGLDRPMSSSHYKVVQIDLPFTF